MKEDSKKSEAMFPAGGVAPGQRWSAARKRDHNARRGGAASGNAKAQEVIEKLKAMRLANAAKTLQDGVEQTLAYYHFPREHRRRIRTNNALERIIREIRRRTRVVGAFPDGQSALMLCAARLRHIAGSKWGQKRYHSMDLLKDQELEQQVASA